MGRRGVEGRLVLDQKIEAAIDHGAARTPVPALGVSANRSVTSISVARFVNLYAPARHFALTEQRAMV